MVEFKMPSLGADMDAGTLVEWKVAAGDAVKRGDIVAVVETDKGAIEVEIWEDGVVDRLLVVPQAKVPVGTVLALVRGRGEPASPAPAPAATPPAAEAAAAAAAGPPAAAAPPPAAARVTPPAGAPGRVRASPAARARARELGVDLSALSGTGPGGAVTIADVEAAARAREPAAPPIAGAEERVPASPPAPAPVSEPRPPGARPGGTTPIRQAIAAAMARSKREIPHYYLSAEVDLSAALAWLGRENERRSVADRLLPVVLLLKAVALAAREIPEVNGFCVDGVFRPAAAVHLGVAISLRQGGLVAPALHDVDRKDLGTLMRELGDLVARTRAGKLRSSELSDGTLTVTNLGDLGVRTVYGVIYPPQVALVGFGRVLERPRAVGGKVEVRPLVDMTLSGDHRVSDGLRGAQFLGVLDRLLQQPEAL